MDFFPLFLELREQPVLVVGGAESARNKLELLLILALFIQFRNKFFRIIYQWY